jgi:hypothetical protein
VWFLHLIAGVCVVKNMLAIPCCWISNINLMYVTDFDRVSKLVHIILYNNPFYSSFYYFLKFTTCIVNFFYIYVISGLSLFICINKTFYKMCNQRFLINIFFDWTMIKKFAVRFIEINIIWIVIHQWIIFTKTNGIRLNCSAVWHNLFLGLIQIVVYFK